MNRSTMLSIVIGLGLFTLVYALPLLGLSVAVEQGWYAAALLGAAPILKAPRAFWLDDDGTEHEVESITPHRSWPEWKLVRFTNPDMDTSLVQARHIVVRRDAPLVSDVVLEARERGVPVRTVVDEYRSA